MFEEMDKQIEIIEINGVYYTTSLNIATYTGKRHDHVVRDIEKLISKLVRRPKIGASYYFIERRYATEQNKSVKMYLLTKMGTAWLLNRYTGDAAVDFQLDYNERFFQMEQYILETKEYLIKAHEETVASLRAENKALVERANTILESSSYFKVRTYFDAQGIKLTTEECKSLGMEATKYCNRKVIPIKPEFTDLGKTNTYPTSVLQLLHKQYITSKYNTLGLFS